MKPASPSLSMAMPVTTSSCIATKPVSSSRLKQPSETMAPSTEETHVSTCRDKKKLTPLVPPPIEPPAAQFSTGVTALKKVIVNVSQPPSLLPPFQQEHPLQQSKRVTVYKPAREPPRFQPTSLSFLLQPESNFESLRADSLSEVSLDNDDNSSPNNDWFQLPTSSNDWAPLVRDFGTLIALDILRVFLVHGTFRVFMNRAVFRSLKAWQRQVEYPIYVDRNLATSTVSRCALALPPNNDWTVRGIPNYGQTCFMNSVLQALTSMPIVLTYLHQVVQLQHVTATAAKSQQQVPLSESLWKLLQSLQHSSMPLVDARVILRKVSSSHAQFQNGGEQQDAQEFLQALLGLVISEAQLDKSHSISSLESSILSSTSEEELLSLATFLNRMNDEQLRTTSSLEKSSDVSPTVNGHADDALVEQQQQQHNGHGSHAERNNAHTNGFHPKKKEAEDHLSVEEKKQEDFENGDGPTTLLPTKHAESSPPIDTTLASSDVTSTTACTTIESESELSSSLSSDDQSSMSASSTQLMLQTLSPSTPSPLSGWLGSTLQCCSCHHVRPIQNAPFLDIPIVPLSVSHYMSVRGGMKRPPSHDTSSCSLTDCLREFTSVERVHDVECRNCTIRQDIAQLEEEVFMLKGAVETITSRRKSDHVEGLQSELARAESKLSILRKVNPDDGDDGLEDLSASMDELDFGVEKKRKRLKRGTAKKCLLFTRLPTILCIHIQRRYYDSSTERMAKTRQHVAFPEILDLSPFCAYGGGREGMPFWAGSGSASSGNSRTMAQRRSSKLYRLMSVIEHCGNAFSGHYQTYRQVEYGNGSTDRWVLISDQNVTPVTWMHVRRCQAYMLFYESL